MKSTFVDTSFFIAVASPRDDAHQEARRWAAEYRGRFVTTTWILLEFGNFVSVGPQRRPFAAMANSVLHNPQFLAISVSAKLVRDSIAEYDRAVDKHWSLTDCCSFIVMRARKIHDVLTTDHHFRQAGFRVLL